MVRKVIYLSGTRADFGLMRSTLVQAAALTQLSVAVTGMHLEPCYGNTAGEIEAAGLRICGRIPIDVQTRDPGGMSRAVGQCLVGITDLLLAEQPDALLLLGDRGEMLAGAIAALHLGIITIHIHGGERSGTVDEPVRHAISKLCTYHFVSTLESRERLLRMGELPDRVIVTGAPGLDDLLAQPLMRETECRRNLGIEDGSPFLLVLFHPVVQQAMQAFEQTAALLSALAQIGLPVVWIEPNSDAGSLEVLRALELHPLPTGSVRYRHLPRPLFCSAMHHAAAMVGNSSAGILEAASYGTPVVNVGDRQRSRERNANVRDVPAEGTAIVLAVHDAVREGRLVRENRYGFGGAGKKISQLLATLPIDRDLLEKTNAY